MTLPSALAHTLAARCGGHWELRSLNASSFCGTWRAAGGSDDLFVKTAPANRADVLAAEADGLDALSATKTIRVPAVVDCWVDPEQQVAMLALEWLDFAPRAGSAGGEALGRALARLHRAPPVAGGGRFGWHRDNRLGATPQRNRWSASGGLAGWLDFYARERLGALRDRLGARGSPSSLTTTVDRVIDRLPRLFADGHVPRASLIHGDLWSGNWGFVGTGVPVVFDPAVSISDAEADLAMMELFGSPPPEFWSSYRDVAGLAPGYGRRRDLYQLYHLLNHELLFGGYAGAVLATSQRLLSGAQ